MHVSCVLSLPGLPSFCGQCPLKKLEIKKTGTNMQEHGVSYQSEKWHHTSGWSQCYTSEPPSWLDVEVVGCKIGSDGEKSCGTCFDRSTRLAMVFCCTCHHAET